MPINIPNDLPAWERLSQENIFIMSETRAAAQDIRPLRILILNLMPKKIDTERQLLRMLSNTPLQVDVELLQTATHASKNTAAEHLLKFYKVFDDIKEQYFDGMIITGAPVEHLEFEEVGYWDELCQIMEWSKSHVHSTLHICWGAQAALHYHYGLQKVQLPQKMFGVFPHTLVDKSVPLLRGFDEIYWMPHSRHTEIPAADIRATGKLYILSSSPIAGVNIVSNRNGRQVFILGHSEYEAQHAGRRILPRSGQRAAHPAALPLFPGRRSGEEADPHLAQPRISVLLQLAQLLRLPVDALRPGEPAARSIGLVFQMWGQCPRSPYDPGILCGAGSPSVS